MYAALQNCVYKRQRPCVTLNKAPLLLLSPTRLFTLSIQKSGTLFIIEYNSRNVTQFTHNSTVLTEKSGCVSLAKDWMDEEWLNLHLNID